MKKEANKKVKIMGIVVLILLICVSIWYIRVNYIDKKKMYNYSDLDYVPKKYEVNEYANMNIDDQTMASIYLNDFLNIMYYDYQEAYLLLDENYREAKFGSVESFKNFVDNYDYSKSTIKKFGVEAGRYDVYDIDGNIFIFVTEGVMQYKVYLDYETVAITDY